MHEAFNHKALKHKAFNHKALMQKKIERPSTGIEPVFLR